MREIVIIGDVEMGVGNLTDDFISDKALGDLIAKFSKKKNPVDLVYNGDTFDFLKAPLIVRGQERYPKHITKEVALNKLKYTVHAHRRVFLAWNKFLRSPNNRIFFVIGNHDLDLYFPAVQHKLKSLLGENTFVVDNYNQGPVHAEHGHKFDLMNAPPPKKFKRFRGKRILNVHWIGLAVIHKMVYLKNEYPFLERIKPIPVLFRSHKNIGNIVNSSGISFVLFSFFSFPLRLVDPVYKLPLHKVAASLLRYIKKDYAVNVKKRLKKSTSEIMVFGHEHKKKIFRKGNKVIIQPDTWRDEYFLDEKTQTLRSKKKHYVHIKLGKSTTWDVKHFPIKRSTFDFKDVAKNEFKYVQLARKEEGYS